MLPLCGIPALVLWVASDARCPAPSLLAAARTMDVFTAARTGSMRMSCTYRQRESDSRSAVEDANAKFYRAFKNRDLKVGRLFAGASQQHKYSRPCILTSHKETPLSNLRCSLQAMSEIWGSGEHVQCIHPAAGCIAGRDNVSQHYLQGRTAKTVHLSLLRHSNGICIDMHCFGLCSSPLQQLDKLRNMFRCWKAGG